MLRGRGRQPADGFWKRDTGGSAVAPTLAGTQVLRHDWTFGARRLHWKDIDLPGSAAGALAFLERASAAWIYGVAGVTDAVWKNRSCDWPGGPQGRPFAKPSGGPTGAHRRRRRGPVAQEPPPTKLSARRRASWISSWLACQDKYAAAFLRSTGSSRKSARALLQQKHRMPRTFPVEWS